MNGVERSGIRCLRKCEEKKSGVEVEDRGEETEGHFEAEILRREELRRRITEKNGVLEQEKGYERGS